MARAALEKGAPAACLWLTVPLLVFAAGGLPAAEIELDPSVRYQTIQGWSVNPWAPWVSAEQRDQVLDEAVNELGLTRVRAGPPSGNRSDRRNWEWLNDIADPYEINWGAFSTAAVDAYVTTWIAPFKQRVEANGEKFDLWISPSFFDGGSSGTVPAWLLHSPAEYAEYATAYLLYLKNKHRIEADYYVICNEPGNGNAFQPPVVARMIRTLGPRLKALGLKTRIQFPDGVNARSSWRYIQFVRNDARVWRHVGALSYHLYGPAAPFRSRMRDLAIAKGLPNAQTEHMGRKFSSLYDDLTLGGVSYWSIYGWGGVIEIHHDRTSFSRGRDYWPLRQVMHYVRPGAVRVGAASDDRSLRVLAFVRRNRTTVVLLNDARSSRKQAVSVKALPAGKYGVCQSVNRRACEELGVRQVGADKTLKLDIARGAVLTIYPHPRGNQPPTVTDWSARPTFLTRPKSEIALSASATDPEKDAISYAWSVNSAPGGANVALATAGAGTTKATGLTAPGNYVFSVAVSDPTHTVRREVRLTVFADNQPPKIYDLHNRIPVMVTLPAGTTILRAWPKDLEGDRLETGWRIVRQPAGASVALEMLPGDKNKTARRATKMTAAGEYVFRFGANDGKHTTREDLKVTVQAANRSPVIHATTADPANLTLPESTISLAAKTGDPDGDVITHWWSLKRAPAGAEPAFGKQGVATTNVTGLKVAGEYVFTLTVVDRTKVARRDVKVTVRRKKQ